MCCPDHRKEQQVEETVVVDSQQVLILLGASAPNFVDVDLENLLELEHVDSRWKEQRD